MHPHHIVYTCNSEMLYYVIEQGTQLHITPVYSTVKRVSAQGWQWCCPHPQTYPPTQQSWPCCFDVLRAGGGRKKTVSMLVTRRTPKTTKNPWWILLSVTQTWVKAGLLLWHPTLVFCPGSVFQLSLTRIGQSKVMIKHTWPGHIMQWTPHGLENKSVNPTTIHAKDNAKNCTNLWVGKVMVNGTHSPTPAQWVSLILSILQCY